MSDELDDVVAPRTRLSTVRTLRYYGLLPFGEAWARGRIRAVTGKEPPPGLMPPRVRAFAAEHAPRSDEEMTAP